MSEGERIVAIAFLTHENVKAIGQNFARIYPVDETPCFNELLQAIDEAEQANGREGAEGD